MDTTAQTEVLVVGAGPVGLTLANLLHRHGVRYRLIDQVPPRPVVESRAEGVHIRTQELFEQLGFAEEAFALARPLLAATLYAEGRVLGKIDFRETGLSHPNPIILQQGHVEQLLAQNLERHGGQVERPLAFLDFTQDDDHVNVRLQRPNGEIETVQARFMVACDGGRSTVRRQLNAQFDGQSNPSQFVLADVSIDFADEPLNGDLHLFLDPLLLFGQLADGYWKVASIAPDGFSPEASPDDIVKQLQLTADKHGIKCWIHSPRWTSSFRISTRMVSQFRHGRVLLAGDAAHIHSPMGGQGMNEGMQDALNLAWKLAYHLQGKAGQDLLDTYQAERGPLIADVLNDTALMSKVLFWSHPMLLAARNSVMGFVTNLDAAQPVLRELFSGATRAYASNPILRQRTQTPGEYFSNIVHGILHPNPADDLAFAGGPAPGVRAPDATGISANGQPPQRLLTHLAGDFRHRLLLFGGDHLSLERYTRLYQYAMQLTKQHGDWLRPLLVLRHQPEASLNDSKLLIDTVGQLHDRYGARHECLYLIRPDGFIGYRSQPVMSDDFSEYLNHIFALGDRIEAIA
ncbi:hypothetical protein DYU11_18645 [Fibrisoma montanum]|uniref:FAD-binding domain-containing protein n=1 Tax=Fibrisoma montanum TaxID=2305895 RepID=A0A418M6K7_9BACT|nr:FAD-dependent monooxygenase [Fibrisoma montanum]RIV21426.1 hypothetical protein DYU11_18645 [Fibrisoma montanum]